MRFVLPSGIHFCTASLAGRQINPNKTSAANGLRTTAITQVIKSPSHASRQSKELRDDPEFTDPLYERMAGRIIAHAFTLFARWLAFAVVGSAVGALLIWLGTIGVFFK